MLGFDEMAIFASVVEMGSFTAAGQKLNIPKSTVSQKVAQLEATVGVRLLNRSTRKVHLTGAGEVFFNYCQQMVQQANQGRRAITSLQEHPTGNLRITCPEVSSHSLMPLLFNTFRKRYSQITLELFITDEYVDLIDQGFDFAFRAGKLSDSNLISRHLGNISRVLVASPDYLNQYGRPESPELLVSHRCLKHQSLPIWQLQKGNEKRAHKPASEWMSNSISFLFNSAILGDGIALLPSYICIDEINNNQLEVVLPDWEIPDNHYYLLYPSRTHLPKAQRTFIDFIMEYNLEKYINITFQPI